MYLVLRFDDQVNVETQSAIINSVLPKEIITHFYYLKEDNTIDLDAFNAATVDSSMTYAFDQRFPVAHVTISDSQLPKDLLYVYLGVGCELLTAQTTIEAICSMMPPAADANETLKYAWERIQIDMGEIAANAQINPARVVSGTLGDVKLLIAKWDGVSEPFETEMMANMPQPEEGDCEGCADCQCHAVDTELQPDNGVAVGDIVEPVDGTNITAEPTVQ